MIDCSQNKKAGLTQYQQPLQEKTRNQAWDRSLYEDSLAFLVHFLKHLITKTPFPTRSTRNLVTATSTHGTRPAENLTGEGSHSAPPPGVGGILFHAHEWVQLLTKVTVLDIIPSSDFLCTASNLVWDLFFCNSSSSRNIKENVEVRMIWWPLHLYLNKWTGNETERLETQRPWPPVSRSWRIRLHTRKRFNNNSQREILN